MKRIDVAGTRVVAARLLSAQLPMRWRHVQAVAARAALLSEHLGRDGAVLVSAAWLHDIGYSPDVVETGFHPLDGANYLSVRRFPRRLCALIAHHSAAAIEAQFFGCSEKLDYFSDEQTLTRDLLWYCDMTVGPDGKEVSFEDRIEEVRARYGPNNYVSYALDSSIPAREDAVKRAKAWIDSVGLGGQV